MSLVSDILNKICDVQRQAMISDGAGGFVANGAPTTIATGIRCTIQPISKTFNRHAGGREVTATHTMYIEYPGQQTFLPNDKVTNVKDIHDPTDIDIDTVITPQGVKTVTRQYLMVSGGTDPNEEHDHLEIPLEIIKGRPLPV